MAQLREPDQTHLFVVRLWKGGVQEDEIEYRGQITAIEYDNVLAPIVKRHPGRRQCDLQTSLRPYGRDSQMGTRYRQCTPRKIGPEFI